MKLTIIIVSYNVSNYLKQCIKSIYASDIKEELEIIVVDNNSQDNTSNIIKSEYPEIHYIQNNENVGFSKAVNIALKETNGKYICLLNPDTLVCDDTFSILIDYLSKHGNVGMIGPRIINSNGIFQISSKRSFPYLLPSIFKLTGISDFFPNNKFLSKYNLTFLNEDQIHSVDSISGACMMFSRYILNVNGLLDENFFMYGEDIDYCTRTKENGYLVVYNPNSSIIHYKGKSSQDALFKLTDTFYLSMLVFYRKYKNNFFSWKFFSPIIIFFITIRKFLAYAKLSMTQIIPRIIDLLIIFIIFFLVSSLWFSSYHGKPLNSRLIISILPLLINISISWILSSSLFNLYKNNYFSYGRCLVVSIITLFISATTTYLIGFFAHSRLLLLMTVFLAGLICSVWRVIAYYLYIGKKTYIKENSSLFFKRTVILGHNEESRRITKIIEQSSYSNLLFIGYSDYIKEKNVNNFLGVISDMKNIVKKYDITEIIIPENWGDIKKVIHFLDLIKKLDVNINIMPNQSKLLLSQENIIIVPEKSKLPVQLPLFEKYNNKTKRFFDIFLALFLVILTLPIQLYFIVLNKINFSNIWIDDKKKISVINFNSKWNIFQNIPLVYLILKGDLTFVGSKIHRDENSNPNYLIKPGLTGLMENEHKVANITISKRFDEYYALHYSIFLDFEILIKTIIGKNNV